MFTATDAQVLLPYVALVFAFALGYIGGRM
jgi:hypothetical protein